MKAIFLAVALLMASTASAKWVESQTITMESPRIHQGENKKRKRQILHCGERRSEPQGGQREQEQCGVWGDHPCQVGGR